MIDGLKQTRLDFLESLFESESEFDETEEEEDVEDHAWLMGWIWHQTDFGNKK